MDDIQVSSALKSPLEHLLPVLYLCLLHANSFRSILAAMDLAQSNCQVSFASVLAKPTACYYALSEPEKPWIGEENARSSLGVSVQTGLVDVPEFRLTVSPRPFE